MKVPFGSNSHECMHSVPTTIHNYSYNTCHILYVFVVDLGRNKTPQRHSARTIFTVGSIVRMHVRRRCSLLDMPPQWYRIHNSNVCMSTHNGIVEMRQFIQTTNTSAAFVFDNYAMKFEYSIEYAMLLVPSISIVRHCTHSLACVRYATLLLDMFGIILPCQATSSSYCTSCARCVGRSRCACEFFGCQLLHYPANTWMGHCLARNNPTATYLCCLTVTHR